ncbi:hypothetical protein WUBG_08060, partial [Wuchereria bancrofti]
KVVEERERERERGRREKEMKKKMLDLYSIRQAFRSSSEAVIGVEEKSGVLNKNRVKSNGWIGSLSHMGEKKKNEPTEEKHAEMIRTHVIQELKEHLGGITEHDINNDGKAISNRKDAPEVLGNAACRLVTKEKKQGFRVMQNISIERKLIYFGNSHHKVEEAMSSKI